MEMLFGVHDTNERQLNPVAEQASDVFLHMGELGRQKNRSMTGRMGGNARGPLQKVDPAPMTGVTAEGLHMDISFGPGGYRRTMHKKQQISISVRVDVVVSRTDAHDIAVLLV